MRKSKSFWWLVIFIITIALLSSCRTSYHKNGVMYKKCSNLK